MAPVNKPGFKKTSPTSSRGGTTIGANRSAQTTGFTKAKPSNTGGGGGSGPAGASGGGKATTARIGAHRPATAKGGAGGGGEQGTFQRAKPNTGGSGAGADGPATFDRGAPSGSTTTTRIGSHRPATAKGGSGGGGDGGSSSFVRAKPNTGAGGAGGDGPAAFDRGAPSGTLTPSRIGGHRQGANQGGSGGAGGGGETGFQRTRPSPGARTGGATIGASRQAKTTGSGSQVGGNAPTGQAPDAKVKARKPGQRERDIQQLQNLDVKSIPGKTKQLWDDFQAKTAEVNRRIGRR